MKMKRADGSMTETDEEVAKVIAEYFGKEVFGQKSEYDPRAVDSLEQRSMKECLGEPPSVEEFAEAVKRMNPRKAPGPNGVPAELIQLLSEPHLRMLYDHIIAFWVDPNYDISFWKETNLKLLPKKGDLGLPKNWRPISLLDTLMKVLSTVTSV